MKAGDAIEPRGYGPLEQPVLDAYAAASGDNNPLHLDPAAARASGFDSVIGHGMLSMAYLGRYVTESFPGWRLVTLEARFVATAPVGSWVSCAGNVIDATATMATLSLTAFRDDGTLILTGGAQVAAR